MLLSKKALPNTLCPTDENMHWRIPFQIQSQEAEHIASPYTGACVKLFYTQYNKTARLGRDTRNAISKQ